MAFTKRELDQLNGCCSQGRPKPSIACRFTVAVNYFCGCFDRRSPWVRQARRWKKPPVSLSVRLALSSNLGCFGASFMAVSSSFSVHDGGTTALATKQGISCGKNSTALGRPRLLRWFVRSSPALQDSAPQLANVLDFRAPLPSMPELHDHGPVRKEVNISASQLSEASRPLATAWLRCDLARRPFPMRKKLAVISEIATPIALAGLVDRFLDRGAPEAANAALSALLVALSER
jgi:hypothetical protein